MVFHLAIFHLTEFVALLWLLLLRVLAPIAEGLDFGSHLHPPRLLARDAVLQPAPAADGGRGKQKRVAVPSTGLFRVDLCKAVLIPAVAPIP